MIQPNDRIAVGVSGGKDSVALLVGLCKLREYIGIPYEVVAITLDPCFGGMETDYTPIAQLCEQLGVPYVLKRTEIGQIIFDVRNESNPCSLCARMRRGCLHDAAKENNCNKIALGHHYETAPIKIMRRHQENRMKFDSPKMERKTLPVRLRREDR